MRGHPVGSLVSLVCLAASTARAQTINDVPRPHPDDPHRFQIAGQTWVPVGYYPSIGALTSDQQDYVNYYKNLIDKQAAHGINYFRNVFTMGQQYGTSTIPYKRPGPGVAADGRPKFDLTQFNQAHFDYWRNIVSHARSKGVVVQICILDAWHNKALVVEDNGDSQHEWGMKYDFYYGGNNVNGIDTPTLAQWTSTTHPVFNYHKALVRKLIDTIGDLPNIVWEVCNEQFSGDPNFQPALADEISSYERSKGLIPHLVMPRDLPNHEMLEHCLVDVGQIHASMVSNFSRNQPLFHDNDCRTEAFTPDYRRQKAWACLTAGGHINFFHFDMWQQAVLDSTDVADGMRFLGYTRKFVSDLGVNLVGMVPSDGLVSNGWCLARGGDEYVVYLRSGGSTTVSALPASFTARWFNPRTGTSQTAVGGPQFTVPDTNDWVLHVVKSTGAIGGGNDPGGGSSGSGRCGLLGAEILIFAAAGRGLVRRGRTSRC